MENFATPERHPLIVQSLVHQRRFFAVMVSVIMPVYNSGIFLRQTLSSLAAQTYAQWELIVVDDGSTDGSLQIVEAFRKLHEQQVFVFHSSGQRSGASACRNIGIAKSRGALVLFLDSDDLLEPFCLEQRMRVMQQHPNADWAVFNQYEWRSELPPPYRLFNKKVTTRHEALRYFFQMEPPWQTMAPLWKRQAIDAVKGFDEALYFMEDPDLHMRALLSAQLQVVFATALPADCFYRAPLLDTAAKAEAFYNNSIVSRFAFLHKLLQWFPQGLSPKAANIYRGDIRTGFLDFVKVLVLSRVQQYTQLFSDTVQLLHDAKILSAADVFRLRIVAATFKSRSPVVSRLRLRGIMHRLL